MTESYVINFFQNAIMVAVILVAPVLLTSLIIGGLVSVFQAATSISDITLTFVPKVVGVGLVLAFLGSWMAQQLLSFTANILINLPNMPR